MGSATQRGTGPWVVCAALLLWLFSFCCRRLLLMCSAAAVVCASQTEMFHIEVMWPLHRKESHVRL